MTLTPRTIMKNRKIAVAYLLQDGLKKATGQLINVRTEGRCCLGHMCDALGIKYEIGDGLAPDKLIERLGLHDNCGGSYDDDGLDTTFDLSNFMKDQTGISSLISFNDTTRATTKTIGKYLESVIKGGDNTPWEKVK